MQVISGKDVARSVKEKIKIEVNKIISQGKRVPSIVCIMVGEDPASTIYIRNKEKIANKLGLKSQIIRLADNIEEEILLKEIFRINNDKTIDALLVQLPLPKHIDEKKILMAIAPKKDVDVFHPHNMGAIWNGYGKIAPCTPAGIMEMFKYYKIPVEGKNAVIVGRSNIVGKPLAALLLKENATVTICHSKTKNLKQQCSSADILIAAIGKAKFISRDYVKSGAVLIDVGINREQDKVYGDIDYDDVTSLCSAITPVPGGVGLMTTAMLMQNTLSLYKENIKNE